MTAAHGSRVRWWICLLTFLATTINYMDRQILSLLKPLLDQQFHWTNAEFGLINAWFQGSYAVGVLGFGWFVDRYGVRVGYTVSVLCWSVSAGLHALAGSVRGFVAARVLLGLSESGNFPAAIKTIALWFPVRERALATALMNSGANAGALIAPAIIPWMALTWSWQTPFLVAGGAGLVWVLVWRSYYRPPESHPRISKEELAFIESDRAVETVAERPPWLSLLGYRQAWAYIAAKFLTDPVWYFFLIWLPDYFKKARGLDIRSSWPCLIAIYGTVTVLSLAGGWFTGFLLQRNWSITRARKTGMLCFAVLVTPVLLASSASNWTAVWLIGLAGAAHQAWSSTIYTTVSDMFPKQVVASVIGMGTMAGAIGSIAFTLITGRLLDAYGSAGAHHSYEMLFDYCGCAYLLAFAINHLLAPSFASVKFLPRYPDSGV